MQSTFTPPNLVAIAASAGGIDAAKTVLSLLPAAFPAPVLMVVHRAGYPRSVDALALMFGRGTSLTVRPATTGAFLHPRSVYVAPAGSHMILRPGRMLRLVDSPKINFLRPSADVLLRSVAEVSGPRAIGVVLSGNLSDGADGAAAIRRAGGRVLVQDPRSCRDIGMLVSAVQSGAAEFTLPPESIAHALVAMTMVLGAEPLFRTAPRPIAA